MSPELRVGEHADDATPAHAPGPAECGLPVDLVYTKLLELGNGLPYWCGDGRRPSVAAAGRVASHEDTI